MEKEVENPAKEPKEKLGAYLKRAREAAHLDLQDLSREKKLSLEYLQAIEESRWEVLPGATYARAYILQLSAKLSLDSAKMIEWYSRETGYRPDIDHADKIEVSKGEIPHGSGGSGKGIVIFIFVIILGTVGYNLLKDKINFGDLFGDNNSAANSTELNSSMNISPDNASSEQVSDTLSAEAEEQAILDSIKRVKAAEDAKNQKVTIKVKCLSNCGEGDNRAGMVIKTYPNKKQKWVSSLPKGSSRYYPRKGKKYKLGADTLLLHWSPENAVLELKVNNKLIKMDTTHFLLYSALLAD